MRRRFGRRRRGGGGGEEERGGGSAIDRGWLARLGEAGLVPAAGLEPVADEGVPATLALLARGRDDQGQGFLVAFSPGDAGDALLALVAHRRAAAAAVDSAAGEDDGPAGGGDEAEATAEPTRAYVVSRWSAAARRRLALVGELDVPLHPVEAGALLDGPAVDPEPAPAPAALPPAWVAAGIAHAGTRALFQRALAGLAGLAAKHGGAVRGSGDGVDLVLVARRAARLAVRDDRVVLDAGRGAEALSWAGLAESLDQLEGALRKRIRDARSGPEGLRTRAQDAIPGALDLRAVVPYPLGGAEEEALDAAGLDADGRAVVVAVRDELDLARLGPILDAWCTIQPTLPVLLGGAPPPVRWEAPRLVVAARSVAAPALRVLEGLTVEVTRLDVHVGRDGAVELVPAGTAPARRPAVRGSDRERGGRRRGRGRRGPRRPSRGGEPHASDAEEEAGVDRGRREADAPTGTGERDEVASRADAAERSEARGDEAAEPDRPRYDQLSSFDLDDSFGLEETESGGGVRRRGRRRRGRRRGRSAAGGDDDEAESDEPTAPRAAAEEESSPVREAEAAAEEPEEDTAADEEELGILAEAPEPEEEEPEPMRQERPRRGAILAHADRTSLAAAMLLAREARQVEGVWVYPQSELMTFFRSVAIDLRDDVTIMVVGFRPARDAIQAASLYTSRLEWYDTREWPPEDLAELKSAVGTDFVDVHPGLDSPMPLVLPRCSRRSRFSDKLVDLLAARFSEHDFQRWGHLWWWRLGEMVDQPGEHKNELQPLLTGRPSDLAAQARKEETPPPPPEVAWVGGRDFPLVHFGGYAMVRVEVPPELDRGLAGRIARERYGAHLSFARHEGDGLVILGATEGLTQRPLDVVRMAEHLAQKLSWVEGLPMSDHVARFRIHGLDAHPEHLEAVVAEIGMGRSILEG